jgi:hypothetical protein
LGSQGFKEGGETGKEEKVEDAGVGGGSETVAEDNIK